jgi:Na+/glutamate symporter
LFANDFDKVRPNRRRHPARSFGNAKLIRFEKDTTTMTPINDLIGQVGFATRITEKSFAKRRRLGVELFATLALAVSLMIAATAVSIGMARAQTFHAASPCEAMPLSVASFVGAVMGGKIH